MYFTRKANLTRPSAPGVLDAHAIAEKIEKTIVGDNEPKFKTKKSFSPSAVGYGHGTCARYWHMAFDGADYIENTDATGALNMDNGNYVHDRIQAMFQKAYGEENVELERKIVSEDPPVFGFADLIVDLGEYKAVGEIKSAKQEIFDGIVHKHKAPSYHLVQLLIYMRLLELEHGFFYYENKNTQEFLVLPVTMNKGLSEYTDEIFSWMRRVRDAWEMDEFAKPLSPKRTVKKCTYCPLKAACFERPEGTIEIKPLAVLD
jgi:CRISPR/Cas system-associated exonuclease Cas4 (RecB family)